jgi:hypothetical protein
MDDETRYIADTILEIIDAAANKQVLGTKLASLLSARTNFTSSVHGKLREFVDKNTPDVVRIAPSGKDWIYGRKGVQSKVLPAATFRLSEPVWKTYASPSSPYTLFANKSTGELCVIPPRGTPLVEPWVRIPACPPDVHLEIAKAWVAGLASDHKRLMLEGVLESGSGPQSAFYQSVVTLKLIPEWQVFRRTRISEHFESILRGSGVPLIAPILPTPPASIPKLEPQQSASSLPASEVAESRLREVVLAAVRRMADTELRALPIPVGYVFDILGLR